eukprot:SAG11_NODE_3163_length_2641_cov_8.683714_3_plen_239_part_00
MLAFLVAVIAGGEPPPGSPLTPQQQILSDLWDRHCSYLFDPKQKSVEQAMATMTKEPYVNHIPTMIGGSGHDGLASFYKSHFIFTSPDIERQPISRTVGTDQLVDEMVIRFVHNKRMSWMLPDVEPTHKQVEVRNPIIFPTSAVVPTPLSIISAHEATLTQVLRRCHSSRSYALHTKTGSGSSRMNTFTGIRQLCSSRCGSATCCTDSCRGAFSCVRAGLSSRQSLAWIAPHMSFVRG